MHGCGKCTKVCGILLLALGIIFVLQDRGIWDFWGISWYTAVFLLVGIGHIGSSSCAECQATKKKGK